MSFLLVLLVLSGAVSAAMAQAPATEKDCQMATKLHAEAEAMREFFEPYARGAGFDGPALNSDEGLTGKDSMQTAAKDYLDGCKSGGSTTCDDYSRIRNAAMGGSPASTSAAGMLTNPQSCNIYDSSGNEVTEADAPPGGMERADWMSMFRHEQFHQNNCRSENGTSRTYPEGGSGRDLSPYTLKMKDHAKHAREERTAYAITQDELEDYLEKNCFDPELDLDVSPMKGGCGEGAEGKAKLSSRPPKAGDYAIRSASDWLATPITPVSAGPNGKAETNLQSTCGCCQGGRKQTKVLAYGGPDQSILVKKSPATLSCAQDEGCGSSSGDPHLCTYDGLAYDFHGVGEFVLSRTENFEAQIRYQPVFGVGLASVGTAIAVNLNGDRIALYAGKPPLLMINGTQVSMDEREELGLAAGGSISRKLNRFRLTSPGHYVVEARVGESRVDVRVGIPPKTIGGGLFGDRNGTSDDDLRPATGPALTQPVEFKDLYGVFADAWRATGETSLFDYAEGESVETFADRDRPKRPARVRDLEAAARRKAEAVCRKAGVSDAVNLENCIYDVGLTDDESYAETAAEQTVPRARLTVAEPPGSADGVTLEAPAEAIASFPVEVKINGPAVAGHIVLFAPKGSEVEGKPGNPYSSRAIKAGAEVLSLRAPFLPGEYELRYVERSRDERRILFSRPFRSLVPKVRIEAAASAQAGSSFEIRCAGDMAPGTAVIVVPVGSPDNKHGRSANSGKGGTDKTFRIRKLPAEPGKYEIRYVTGPAAGRQVYARKPLTIR